MSDLPTRLKGCLLGCAVGDSLGLPFEGLKPRRIAKFSPLPLRQRFLFGCGLVSDDTEHSIFAVQALLHFPRDPDGFAKSLAWKFRWWLVCVPAGIGLATLRSIIRLWLGVSPSRSGVFSAGNGAAMRSAAIGVFHHEDAELRREFVGRASRMTHSDPKAEYGAQAVAGIAAWLVNHGRKPDIGELKDLLNEVSEDPAWREQVERTIALCGREDWESEWAAKGISGYVYETVPAAVTAWYRHYGDFEKTVESVILSGGDTDSVAAIAGALAGISVGPEGIPEKWVSGIRDWPFSPALIDRLSQGKPNEPPMISFFLRNLLFVPVVLLHGFRRMFPPY